VKFLVGVEEVTLTDKQIGTLFQPKNFEVLGWVLKEHRKDYKLTTEDIRKVLIDCDDALNAQFLTLFSLHGYLWTNQDFIWVLINYDLKFHPDGKKTLASKLI
jgi:hypothetical protein